MRILPILNFRCLAWAAADFLRPRSTRTSARPSARMKEDHFGGADVPLHASDLRAPTDAQVAALGRFFGAQPFGRFAVTMTRNTALPPDIKPIQLMPGLLRRRWEALTPRFVPVPIEVAFIHEASDRGDSLLETYFGPSTVTIDGRQVNVHHAIMPKGDEALEVADFVVQGQLAVRRGMVSNLTVPFAGTSRSCSERTHSGQVL